MWWCGAAGGRAGDVVEARSCAGAAAMLGRMVVLAMSSRRAAVRERRPC